MNSRALASIALGAAIVLGATGCSMISPQATTLQYAAAEGINVPDSTGPVKVRNVFFVVGDGNTANLVASFINPTAEEQKALVAIEGGGEEVISVPAGGTTDFGVEDHKTFADFTGEPGTTARVSFTSGDGQTQTVYVPILDGSMSYLEEAVPTEAPTPSAK